MNRRWIDDGWMMDELGDEEISGSVCQSVSKFGRRTTVDALLAPNRGSRQMQRLEAASILERDSPPEEKRRLVLYVVVS